MCVCVCVCVCVHGVTVCVCVCVCVCVHGVTVCACVCVCCIILCSPVAVPGVTARSNGKNVSIFPVCSAQIETYRPSYTV